MNGAIDSSPSTKGLGSSIGSGASRFQFKRILGSGSFGTVSLEWDETLQREVAIKRPGEDISPDAKRTFLHEAQLAAKVHHSGVVVVHDFGLDEAGEPYVVYEYLAGSSLKEKLGKSWDVVPTLEVVLGVAEALTAIHAVGLTHRDLKPANILLDAQNKPHITDFGLAVIEEVQHNSRGEVAGTYRYMAPEQVRGEAHYVDGRTDLWALGAILYEMLTGKLPFSGKTQLDLFEQIEHRNPRPPRQWRADIPKPIENLILKLLSKSMDARFATAGDLSEEIRNCLTQLTENTNQVVLPAKTSLFPLAAIAGVSVMALLVFAGIMAVFIGDRFNAKKVDPNPVDAAAKPITAQFVAGTKLDSQIPAEYPTGVWIPLLKQEPWSVIIHAEDKVTFRPGELVIDAEYQVLMRLGETTAPNYSLRVTMEPDSWDADAGLFFGMQPMVARPNSDLTTLLNVRKTTKDKLKVPTGLTIHARTMQFQRGGRQFPEIFLNYNGTETRKPFPENSKQVSIQVDVRKQNITSLFLNHSPIEFTDPVFLNAPTAGVIGVFVLRGKCKFTNAEIRIIREDTP